jgi:hypothetical protein
VERGALSLMPAPHEADDIIPGSRWPCIKGPGDAIVLASAAGYVAFVLADSHVGAQDCLHHAQFRRLYAAPYDSRAIRSWFSMSVANLQEFHAFWLAGKLYARTARRTIEEAFQPSRGRGGAVPKGARYVGTYTAPFRPDGFFPDLHDALVSVGARTAA